MTHRKSRVKSSLFGRLLICALSTAALVGSAVVLPTLETPALAAPVASVATVPESGPINVPICAGTTSTPKGVVNTPAPFVFPDGSQAANELRAGKTIMIYGNTGSRHVTAAGKLDSSGQGGLPYCGARMLENKEIEVDWRFCTDEGKYGCANNSPSGEWTGTPNDPLTSEQKLQISYILMHEKTATKRDRAMTQLQVWCVSEDVAEGTINKAARGYFGNWQFEGDDSVEGKALSDEESRCAYLPELSHEPELEISGPSAALPAGTPATFAVKTNLTTPIEVASSGSSAVQLCPAGQSNATFDGKTLQLSAAGTATLCVNSSGSETATVTVDSGELPQAAELGLLWNGDNQCQVFADYVQGASLRLQESASATFVGSGNFQVTKDFSGVTTMPGDLDDVQIGVRYVVTGGPALPAGTPVTGILLLNAENSFRATGPTLPDGTVVRLEEESMTGLPVALEQQGWSWTVDGVPSQGTEAEITVGDQSVARVGLTNTLAAVQGTFEVRKAFVFEGGTPNLPAGTEVKVLWWVQGTQQDPSQVLVLNEDNGFTATPGADPADPTTFPLGTTILMEEIEQPLPPGVADVIDWGSNTDPTYSGPGNRGRVTISEAWSNPGAAGNEVSEVALTNGLSLDRGSLIVRKDIRDVQPGGNDPTLGTGFFDDAEFLVRATWTHDDPSLQSGGSNVLLLNAANGWATGLGVELAAGTVVTLEEVAAYSSHPSVSWDEEPLWSCENCVPQISDAPGASQTVRITASDTAGTPIPDLAIALTNTYQILTGGFLLEKRVAGDIDRDDSRLEGIEFTVNWESTDETQPEGTLILKAPEWTAQATDDSGQPIAFPLGTEVTLLEATPPEIPGVVWGDDLEWSVGDEGADAVITITEEDATGGPAASLTLTNFADLHEGSFSVAKMVHSIAPVDTAGASFVVNYRSVEEEPAYSGSLAVTNGEETFSGAFPAGTELVLEEALPDPLAGTIGWKDPVFVDGEGNELNAPVTVTIGDGTDVRVQLINTTNEPPVTPGEPTVPDKPAVPDNSGLADTGSEGIGMALILGTVLVLSAAVVRQVRVRRRLQ